jgi:hypothetical protein
VWLVEVDTRRRAVRSVARYSKEETTGMSRLGFRDNDDDDDLAAVSMFHGLAFLPSEVSKYPSCTSGDPATHVHRHPPFSEINLGSSSVMTGWTDPWQDIEHCVISLARLRGYHNLTIVAYFD